MRLTPEMLYGLRKSNDEAVDEKVAPPPRKRTEGVSPAKLRLAVDNSVLTEEQRSWSADYETAERRYWPDGRFTPGRRK